MDEKLLNCQENWTFKSKVPFYFLNINETSPLYSQTPHTKLPASPFSRASALLQK